MKYPHPPNIAAKVLQTWRDAAQDDLSLIRYTPYRDGNLQNIAAAQREAVEKHMKFARNLQIEPSVLQGDDVAQTLVEFARSHKVTQIFIARPQQQKWPLAFGRGLVERVVRLAHDIQVTIVAERRR